MKISFPSFSEYQAVLQSPVHCFSAPELKSSSVETDLWGLPRVRSGGFALTYKLTTRARQVAVRCFYRHIPDRNMRYAAISSFLASNPSEVLFPVRYQPNGILVRGKWYPVTYMPWVEGDTLEAYVVKNVGKPDLMRRLSDELLRLVGELERLGIAHGDLSHRNIMIQGEKMVLVDYDGMYVPGISGFKSCEIGNRHFQLPSRTEQYFNPNLDRFSALVIYLALQALERDPSLWGRYETGGEGFLFTRDDFLNPYQCGLLKEIGAMPGMGPMVDAFRKICTSHIDRVPRLAEFIAARPMELTRIETQAHATPSTPVYDAGFRLTLLTRVGKQVSVVGKVQEVFHGKSPDGEPHIFLSFGAWQAKCFTIVLWREALELIKATGRNPDEYQGKWVRVHGLLSSYNRRPQITISAPTDIHILEDDAEAHELLAKSRNGGEAGFLRPTPSKETPLKQNALEDLPDLSTTLNTGALDTSPDVYIQLDKLYSGVGKNLV